jgi:hypothetical protein
MGAQMTKQVGRLAFRVEGNTWVAYYALPDTMDGALVLGSIKMALVEDKIRKRIFMDLMKNAVGDFLEGKFGPIESWNEQPAPESERSGSA